MSNLDNISKLNKDVKYVKGVGPNRANLLNLLRDIYIRRFNYIFS